MNRGMCIVSTMGTRAGFSKSIVIGTNACVYTVSGTVVKRCISIGSTIPTKQGVYIGSVGMNRGVCMASIIGRRPVVYISSVVGTMGTSAGISISTKRGVSEASNVGTSV
jgi:hypothetical protein